MRGILTRVEDEVSSSTTFRSLITLEIQILIDDARYTPSIFHFVLDIVIANHSFSVRHSLIKIKFFVKGLLSRFQVLLNVRSLFDFPCDSPLLLSATVMDTLLNNFVLMLCENARKKQA